MIFIHQLLLLHSEILRKHQSHQCVNLACTFCLWIPLNWHKHIHLVNTLYKEMIRSNINVVGFYLNISLWTIVLVFAFIVLLLCCILPGSVIYENIHTVVYKAIHFLAFLLNIIWSINFYLYDHVNNFIDGWH